MRWDRFTVLREARRADLASRLAEVRRELGAWAAWMARRARPLDMQGNRIAPPRSDPQLLNAQHALLVEELERLESLGGVDR